MSLQRIFGLQFWRRTWYRCLLQCQRILICNKTWLHLFLSFQSVVCARDHFHYLFILTDIVAEDLRSAIGFRTDAIPHLFERLRHKDSFVRDVAAEQVLQLVQYGSLFCSIIIKVAPWCILRWYTSGNSGDQCVPIARWNIGGSGCSNELSTISFYTCNAWSIFPSILATAVHLFLLIFRQMIFDVLPVSAIMRFRAFSTCSAILTNKSKISPFNKSWN